MSATGILLGAATSAGLSALNNYMAGQQSDWDRSQNYYLNEEAARNAYMRQREMYKDFYSPEALMRQYKEAGLSPSLMFGGTPGQGGMGAPQGSGVAGLQTPFMPFSMLEAAQIAKTEAETSKTKAETKNIETDTTLKEIEKVANQMKLVEYRAEWDILNSAIWENDKQTSIYEIAKQHMSFDSFIQELRENKDLPFNITSEKQLQTLRNIYENANRFERDITVLSEETVSSKFQLEVINALNKEGFADLNAEAACKQLKQEIATNELTETQKAAWNNLIDRLGKKGSTMRDVVVVLGMIFGNFASRTGIKINIPGNK